jgi:hypothetical protein
MVAKPVGHTVQTRWNSLVPVSKVERVGDEVADLLMKKIRYLQRS